MIYRIDPAGPEPIFAQIVAMVKRAAASGKLAPGDRLPTVRELAAELVVNPNTVARAYQMLEAEGVTTSRRGAGTVIAERSAPARADERQRKLRTALDAVLADAVHLGCREEEVRAAFEAAVDRVVFTESRRGGAE